MVSKISDFNFKRFGDGPKKLVAIHGLGSASTAWKPLQRELSKDFELITLDLPGHGNSPMKAVKNMSPEKLGDLILETLLLEGIPKFHLIGNSLGGWITLEMASKYPENILSVTALAPAGLWLKPKAVKSFPLDFSRILAKIFYKSAPLLLKIKFIKFISFGLVSPRWEKLSLETCVDAAEAMGTSKGYEALWNGTLHRRFDKEISPQIPVTIIFGDIDRTLPAINCQERSLAPQHCNWIELAETGHAPMWDSLDKVLEQLSKTTE